MNPKIVVIFLLLCSLIVAGCVTDEDTGTDGNVSDENQSVVTGEDNVTTGMDNESPSTNGEMPVDENNTSITDETGGDSGVTVVESTGPRTYTVTLKNFLAQPSNLTINEGDSVFWINMNQPNRIFVIVSNEDLWENKSLTYRSSFIYTFEEPGEYSYYILGWEDRMKGTITVK